MLLATARNLGDRIVAILQHAGARRTMVVGETRRGVGVVGELSVVVADLPADDVERVLRENIEGAFAFRRDAAGISFHAPGYGPGRVRAVRDEDWVRAVLLETGDEGHVAWLRNLAKDRGMRFGRVARNAADEAGVYRALSLTPVPPELRSGVAPSVPAALLATGAIHGVFHVHTDWSDGCASIVTMAQAAFDAGFSYVGISDHSQAASYARGLDAERLMAQAQAVTVARRELPDMTILHGVEVDILADGSLDLDDPTLASLDFVIASVHTSLQLGAEDMTDRLVRAVSHPLVTILGHPTGRLVGVRRGYSFDVGKVARAAADHGTLIEINANAHRLDPDEAVIREALTHGASFCINPDAHSPHGLLDTALGVKLARRASVPTSRVFNAQVADDVRGHLAERNAGARRKLACPCGE